MADRIEPFVIAADGAALDDLRDRLRRTRWPERETVADWSQGVPLAYVRDLCGHWADRYDWRATQARLNRIPQFTTRIDGLDVHFLHVRSPHPDAVPLIMTHGWPGSFLEFERVLGPLADPTAHAGDAAGAFHVVVPSLPGYGFSGKPATPGWDIHRIAGAWAELMTRLGYQRFLAQGSDWGGAAALPPLGRAALHEHRVLERARPRRPFRRVGAARPVPRRGPCRRPELPPGARVAPSASGGRAAAPVRGRSGRGVEPLLERRSCQDRARARQQAAFLVDDPVGVARVAHSVDLRWVTAPGGEQRGRLDQALLPRPGDLGERRRGPAGPGGQVGENLGDGPGRDELGAHPRHVAHLAAGAPVDKLRDELVELCGAQHQRRDRARQHRPLVCDLRGAVASGEAVGADDGYHADPPHAGPLAGLLQVPGRGGEERGGRLLFGRGPGGRVDDALDARQGSGEAVPGDHVHSP